jgi:mono/diheme cytochrome c family protein
VTVKVFIIFAVLILGIAGFGALAWRPEIEPVGSAVSHAYDLRVIQRGAQLVAMGNCVTCHTATNGKRLAGGRPITISYGTIYSRNITPDPDTGIGQWSERAFQRAMHDGIDRRGRHLYPVFPYYHFRLVTADDNRAIYAYLMSQSPIRVDQPDNRLIFPFNIRMFISVWKFLYFHRDDFTVNPLQSKEWNYGAYLVEGLAHCGACHTPQNALGAEKKNKAYDGGESEGWTAYAINGASPAPIPWDTEGLTLFLQRGWHDLHGIARGPMASVTANLRSVSQSDVQAISTYVVSLMGNPTTKRRREAEIKLSKARAEIGARRAASPDSPTDPWRKGGIDGTDYQLGSEIYAAACSSCHESGQSPPSGGIHFSLSSDLHAPDPRNVVNVILAGVPPAAGSLRSERMPGFADVFPDTYIVELLKFLRARFTDEPAWMHLEESVREKRNSNLCYRKGWQRSPRVACF